MTIIFITLAGERVETSDPNELKRRAANGEITPNTVINVDGKVYSAGSVAGLVFNEPAKINASSDRDSNFLSVLVSQLKLLGRICVKIVAFISPLAKRGCRRLGEEVQNAKGKLEERNKERRARRNEAESGVPTEALNSDRNEERAALEKAKNERAVNEGEQKMNANEPQEGAAKRFSEPQNFYRPKPISPEAEKYLKVLKRFIYLVLCCGAGGGLLTCIGGIAGENGSTLIVGISAAVAAAIWARVHLAILGLVREFLRK